MPQLNRPSRELAEALHRWNAAARTRLLRRVGLFPRKQILEIGSGWGFTAIELAERFRSPVIALDPEPPERFGQTNHPFVTSVQASVEAMPFDDRAFDLVFAEFTWMWIQDWSRAIAEVSRVLAPGGVILAIEPDYGGLMEAPSELALKDLWIDALSRSGADPQAGRSLAQRLNANGFQVDVLLLDRIEGYQPDSIGFLKELPLTPDERETLCRIQQERASRDDIWVHLPCWLITARESENWG